MRRLILGFLQISGLRSGKKFVHCQERTFCFSLYWQPPIITRYVTPPIQKATSVLFAYFFVKILASAARRQVLGTTPCASVKHKATVVHLPISRHHLSVWTHFTPLLFQSILPSTKHLPVGKSLKHSPVSSTVMSSESSTGGRTTVAAGSAGKNQLNTALEGTSSTVDEDVDELADALKQVHVQEKGVSYVYKEHDVPETIHRIASWIESGKIDNILVLSGAGVSVAAGIPDFRTPGTGLYDNLQKYNLPYPEAVFDLNFYRRNPQPFVSLAKEIWPGISHLPTLTHSFLTLLANKGLLLRNYSQNIDGLEFLANLHPDKLVECHGHFRTASCVRCGKAADGEIVKETIVFEGKAPKCSHCKKGFVKPDIVFFGEGLPPRFHSLLEQDLERADCVLILGTSLQVAPVSMIPDMVEKSCKRILFNRELVGSFDLSSKDRDVFHQGDCDDSIASLSKRLGWYEDLVIANRKVKEAIQNTKTKSKKS